METLIDAATDVVVDAEVEAPEVEDTGQAEDFSETVEQPNVLNLDEYGDYVVELNGEFVPVSELKGGGLRQQDYTRKTQELAELRREAEQGLTFLQSYKVNPVGTLQYLAQQHGMTFAEAQALMEDQQQSDDWGYDDTSSLSPLEQRLAALEQLEQQRAAERELSQAFNQLKAKYGDDFNEQEVARAAAGRGIYDPSLLEMVYRDLAFEKLTQARTQAVQQAQAEQTAKEQARRQAAAEAAAATGASGGAVGVETPPPSTRHMTVREALEASWDALYG